MFLLSQLLLSCFTVVLLFAIPAHSDYTDPTAMASLLYEKLTAQLNPSRRSGFQLLGGSKPLAQDDAALYLELDQVPKPGLATASAGESVSRFLASYRRLIDCSVLPQTESLDKYFHEDTAKFEACWEKLDPDQPCERCAKAVSSKYYTAVIQHCKTMGSNAVIRAMNSLNDAANFIDSAKTIPKYATNIEFIKNQMTAENPMSIQMTASEARSSEKTRSASTKMEYSYPVKVINVNGNATYDSLQREMSNAEISMKISVNSFKTFEFSPGSLYDWGLINKMMQIKTADYRVWSRTDPSCTWNNFFGPKGVLRTYVAGLVVVDGLQIHVTSSTKFNTSSQSSFASAVQGGYMLFSGEATANSTAQSAFTKEGTLAFDVTNTVGNPMVLARIVQDLGTTPITRRIAAQQDDNVVRVTGQYKLTIDKIMTQYSKMIEKIPPSLLPSLYSSACGINTLFQCLANFARSSRQQDQHVHLFHMLSRVYSPSNLYSSTYEYGVEVLCECSECLPLQVRRGIQQELKCDQHDEDLQQTRWI